MFYKWKTTVSYISNEKGVKAFRKVVIENGRGEAIQANSECS